MARDASPKPAMTPPVGVLEKGEKEEVRPVV